MESPEIVLRELTGGITTENCIVCGTELTQPRYKYDNGMCKGCYWKPRANRAQEGDRCTECGGGLKSYPIWADKTMRVMVTRELKCKGCGKLYN